MVNKRKRTPPKRWVNVNRYRKKREALNQLYKYQKTYVRPNQIKKLHDLAEYAQNNFESGGLSWPFELDDAQLQSGIERAARENFHMKVDIMRGKPGWPYALPGNKNSMNPFFHINNGYWLDYNNAIQDDYKKHLNFRNQLKDFENLYNDVLKN